MAGGQQTTATAQPGGSYVVKPGDTLYKIARSNNVDVENVKRWNNLSDPSRFRWARCSSCPVAAPRRRRDAGHAGGLGQVVLDAAAPLDQPSDSGAATSTPSTATPARRPRRPKTPARAADAGVINWGWPATGQITQGFNNNTKGIDIAGNLGDPVIAAADGKVMYSGNGVRGLGNLIIVNHQNGFITAYAHNRALLVKTGQDVKRGAKIAEIGQSDATSPRLHFEIRRQGTPVDPMQYLPAR